MNFKGGVIVIGSLFWDDTPVRQKWRMAYLKDRSNKVSVPLKIRYGRQSQLRNNTYTMIFSNHYSTGWGQGYILPFKEDIKNGRMLESQAFALAAAEGIWKESQHPSLVSTWGAVGLLVNPKIKDTASLKILKDRWTALYQSNKIFNHQLYRVENETPTIDANGFLSVEWTKELDGFDVLIATPVLPNPKYIVTVDKIADRVNEYFYNNIDAGITTFQDDDIYKLLGPA